MSVQEQKCSPRRMRRRVAAVANRAGEIADIVQQAAAQTEAGVADRQVRVAMAAYFIAEKRGFEPGHELEDWLAAESEIARNEPPSVLKSVSLSPARSAS
jgi:hypothetical protein